jgi:hypothetical protein
VPLSLPLRLAATSAYQNLSLPTPCLSMQGVLGGSAGAGGIGGTLGWKGWLLVALQMVALLGAGPDSVLLDMGAGHLT